MKKIYNIKILMPLLMLAVLLFSILPAGRAEARYNYTVRIYAGAQGTISGREYVTYPGLNQGDRVNFNLRDVSLKDNSKYYVKGIRLAGRDNNTIYASPSFLVETDADYVIAYGLLTDAVAYTVEYVDTAGNELAPSEIYYGNVGDKPVVAFLYIEGYRPNAYNITRTLQADASKNIFRFVYSKTSTPSRPSDGSDSGSGTGPGVEPGPTTDPGTNQPGTTRPSANPTTPAGQRPNINPGGIPVIPAENIDDDDTAGDQDDENNNPDDEGEEIPDEQVPLDDPDEMLDIDEEPVPLADRLKIIGDARMLGIPVWLEILLAGIILAGSYCGYKAYKRRRQP